MSTKHSYIEDSINRVHSDIKGIHIEKRVLTELTQLMKEIWMELVLIELTRLPKEVCEYAVLIELTWLTEENHF